MSIELVIEAIGEVQVQRELIRFGEHAMDTGPLWKQMVSDLYMIETAQFLTEGAHGSGGWAPLKDSTIASKQSRGEDPWILRATENLFHSLTRPGAPNFVKTTKESMLFGTLDSIAPYHQFGTVNMPQRRLIQLTMREREALVKQVQRWIVSGEPWSIYE